MDTSYIHMYKFIFSRCDTKCTHLFAHLEQPIIQSETVADSSASDMKDTASGSESSESRHSNQSDDSFAIISNSSKCIYKY